MAKFQKIQTSNDELNRVQQKIEELATQIGPSSAPNIVTVTASYRVKGTEDVIHCDAQAGPIKVTLGNPSATNRPVTIKQINPPSAKTSVNPVTVVTADGSKTIAGASSYALDDSGTGSVTITATDSQHWPSAGTGATGSSTGTKYLPGTGISISGNVISSTVTGGTTNVLGQFPIQSTGGPNPIVTKSPWLNAAVRYAAPGGDDANDGLAWDTAKKYGYTAAKELSDLGGGVLYLGDGWEWGGPVPRQGMWFRGDGMNVPGFLPDVPIAIIGTGRGTQQGFGSTRQAVGHCGGNFLSEFRTKPGIWLVRTTNIKDFQDLYMEPSVGGGGRYDIGLYHPARLSIDYHRYADGSIRSLPTTSSSRAVVGSGWQDTHVVTLPAGIPIQSATRVGSTVTVTIPQPAGMGWPPWRDGGTVWINSTDVNFPSGAYTVTACQSNLDVITDWGFQYTDAGSGTHTMSPVGTVCSPACQAGDLLDLWGVTFDTPVEFPATQYLVVSVTVTSATQATIVVQQPFGGFNGPNGFVPATVAAAPFGLTLVPQERQYACSTKRYFDNVWSLVPSDIDNSAYAAGPNWDIGGDRAFSPEIDNAYLNGFYYPLICPYDRLRMSSVSIYPRGGGAGGVTLKATVGSQASVVATVESQNCQIDIEDGLLFDTNNGTPPPPLDIRGNGNTIVRVKGDFLIADGSAEPIITRCNPFNIQGLSYRDGNSNWLPSIQGQNAITTLDGSQSFAVSPWVGPVNCVWTDKLLYAGGHPAAWRGISPTSARFANLWPVPASWSPAPTATGIDDPMGGTGAVRYDDTVHGGGTGCTYVRTDNFFAVGGRFIMAGWVRCNGGGSSGRGVMGLLCNDANVVWKQDLDSFAGHPTGRASDILFQLPFGEDGWMFWAFSAQLVATDSATLTYTMQLAGPPPSSGKTTDFFGVTATWAPPGLNQNDIMEYVGTLRAAPFYLKPGHAGTFEGQPFIGHGGLGVDSSVLTTPTGTTTQTHNLPLLAADGTVQAYIPTLPTNSTLQPYTMGGRYVFADQDLVGSGVSPTVWLMAGGINQFNPDATRSEYPVPFAASRCLMYAIIDGGVLGHDITFQLTRNGTNVPGATVVIPSGSVGPATPVTSVVVLTGTTTAADTYGLTESAAAGTGTWSGSVSLWFQ